MLTNVAMVMFGLVLLVAGGEMLVRAAASVAVLWRVSPVVIGLTIVAPATSMPELVVSLRAALVGNPDIALGNVVGSNVFNVLAILGVAALIAPLRVVGNSVRFEWPVMFLAACQLHLLARDGTVDRLEGGFLLAAQVAFVACSIWMARTATTRSEASQFEEALPAPLGGGGRRTLIVSFAVLASGGILLALGASTLVRGATELALAFGAPPRVVGLTVVAAGTSIPELVTSVVAALRGRHDIAVTNVLGSNIFNVFGIMGLTSLVQPVAAHPQIVSSDDWWMIGASALLLPLMKSGLRVSRAEGAVLLAVFAAYLTRLLWSAS